MERNNTINPSCMAPVIAPLETKEAHISDHRNPAKAALKSEIVPQEAKIEGTHHAPIASIKCIPAQTVAERGDHRNPAVAKVEEISPKAPIIAGGDNNVIVECATRNKDKEQPSAKLPVMSGNEAHEAVTPPENAPAAPSQEVTRTKITPFGLAQLLRERFSFKALSDQERLGVYDETLGYYSFMRKKNFPLFILMALDGTPYKPLLTHTMIDQTFEFLVNEPALQASVDDFDCHERLLNVKNGVVSIDNLRLLPHSPNYHFTSFLDVNFNPDVGKPKRFLKMLSEIFDDKDAKFLCIESMAYLLCNNSCAKKIIFFLGVPNSGKSTLSRLLMHFHGRKFVSAIPLERFAGRFEIGSMFHRRLNLCPEAEKFGTKIVRAIKALSGGDPQTVEQKYEDAFLADLKLKFLIASNVLPEVPAQVQVDEGFFSRFLFVPFFKSISVRNRRDNLDKQLFEKEGAEIFLLLLKFLQAWYKNECAFLSCEKSEALLDEFRGLSTATEREYVKTFFVFDENGFSDNTILYSRYPEFCQKKNTRPYTIDELKTILVRVFPMVRKIRKRVEDGVNPIAGLKGIRLRKESE